VHDTLARQISGFPLLCGRMPWVLTKNGDITFIPDPGPAAGSEEGAFFGGGSGGVALDEGYIPADTPERANPEQPNGSLQCVSAVMYLLPNKQGRHTMACMRASQLIMYQACLADDWGW
jgi:hypothetical protein